MDKRLKQVIIGLAVLGVLDSIYMTIFKLTNNEKMCIGSHGCNIVNASGYSSIHGIPVAAVGGSGYPINSPPLFLLSKTPFFLTKRSVVHSFPPLPGVLFLHLTAFLLCAALTNT